MSIICDICAQEVEIISFGTGFVGVCCNKVWYNDEDKPQRDIEQDEEKDTYVHLFLQKKKVLIKQDISDHRGRVGSKIVPPF